VKKDDVLLIERAKRALKASLANTPFRKPGMSNRAYYAVVGSVGKYTIRAGVACHASLAHCDGVGKRKFIVDVTPLKDENGDNLNQDTTSYLSWLLKHSCFADNFITKRAPAADKNSFIVSRCDVPGNYLAAGLMAMRYPLEFPDLVYNWNRLVEAGVSQASAFLLIHFIGRRLDKKTACSMKGRAMGNGNHLFVNVYGLTPGTIKAIAHNEGLATAGMSLNPKYSEHVNYRSPNGIGEMWPAAQHSRAIRTQVLAGSVTSRKKDYWGDVIETFKISDEQVISNCLKVDALWQGPEAHWGDPLEVPKKAAPKAAKKLEFHVVEKPVKIAPMKKRAAAKVFGNPNPFHVNAEDKARRARHA
jgi:hypothetical protein